MKHTKSLLMTALAAISIGSALATAPASETVYITGSTAFRSSANTAINTYATTHGGAKIAWDNATLGSAGNLLYTFTNGAGTNYIDVHWSGSEGGIQSVAGPTNGSNAAVFGYFPLTAVGLTTNGITNNQVGNLTFADTYQSTSTFNGTFQGVTYAALVDNQVGVVSFNWVASVGCAATNIGVNTAQQLLAAGTVPVAMLTGNSADMVNGVYLFGRNLDSGTRLTTFAETGYGVKTPVVQYKYDSTSQIEQYPIEIINGVSSSSLGNSGYSSGGTLCGFMTNSYAAGSGLSVGDASGTFNASVYTGNNYLIGYAGTSDANGKTNGGLIKMAYNGVTSSTNGIAIGQYTFWGYEHLLYNNATASTAAKSVASSLVTGLLATPTATLTPNVNLNDMLVGRNVDGGAIYNNY